MQQLTKRVLESEITDHVGYEKRDPTGRTGRSTVSLPFADAPSTEPQQPDQPLTHNTAPRSQGAERVLAEITPGIRLLAGYMRRLRPQLRGAGPGSRRRCGYCGTGECGPGCWSEVVSDYKQVSEPVMRSLTITGTGDFVARGLVARAEFDSASRSVPMPGHARRCAGGGRRPPRPCGSRNGRRPYSSDCCRRGSAVSSCRSGCSHRRSPAWRRPPGFWAR